MRIGEYQILEGKNKICFLWMVDIDKQRVHKQWVSNAHKKQLLLDAYHAQTANRPGVS